MPYVLTSSTVPNAKVLSAKLSAPRFYITPYNSSIRDANSIVEVKWSNYSYTIL